MISSKPAFIATLVVFVLAVSMVIFALLKISSDEDPVIEADDVEDTAFAPTVEIEDEMQEAAERIIRNNHVIIRLYITRGLTPKPEPYVSQTKPLGNRPEDNIYYVISDEYETLAEIESIVDETFIENEAHRIKNNRLDDGNSYYSEFGRIYHDKNNQLGINADFAEFLLIPYEDYPVNWVNPTYTITPISDTECLLRVKLEVDGRDSVFERTMHKVNGEWYLNRLIHE